MVVFLTFRVRFNCLIFKRTLAIEYVYCDKIYDYINGISFAICGQDSTKVFLCTQIESKSGKLNGYKEAVNYRLIALYSLFCDFMWKWSLWGCNKIHFTHNIITLILIRIIILLMSINYFTLRCKHQTVYGINSSCFLCLSEVSVSRCRDSVLFLLSAEYSLVMHGPWPGTLVTWPWLCLSIT